MRRLLVAYCCCACALGDSIEQLWPAAAALFNAGDYAQAVVQIERCLALVEPSSDLHRNMALVRESARSRLGAAQGMVQAASPAFQPAEAGALVGPPAVAPDAPHASERPCNPAGSDDEDGSAASADPDRAPAGACLEINTGPPAYVLEAAAACASRAAAGAPGADPRVGSASSATLGVCAYAGAGTNAQLFDWIHAQLCAGVSRLELLDDRALADDEREIARWMLQPLLGDRRFVLAGGGNGTAAGGATPSALRHAPADECSSAGAEAEWAFGADGSWAVSLPSDDACVDGDSRRARFWSECVGRSAAQSWVALLNAPTELLLPQRAGAASRAELRGGAAPADLGIALEASARAACPGGTGEQAAAEAGVGGIPPSPASTLRLPFTELAEFGGSANDARHAEAAAVPHAPPRPLLATHVHRADSYGVCTAQLAPAANAAFKDAEAVAAATAGRAESGSGAGDGGGMCGSGADGAGSGDSGGSCSSTQLGGHGEGSARLSATCLRPTDSMLIVRPALYRRASRAGPQWLSRAPGVEAGAPADPPSLPLLLHPEGQQAAGVRAVRLLTSAAARAARGGAPEESGRARGAVDWVGRWHQAACDARALFIEPRWDGGDGRSQDDDLAADSSEGGGERAGAGHAAAAAGGAVAGVAGSEAAGAGAATTAELGPNISAGAAARLPWVASALERLTDGDGVVVLGGVLQNTSALLDVRRAFLSRLPERRKVRIAQGFAQHMCQAIEGHASMEGFRAGCEPQHAELLTLAFERHALALAKALFGDDVILHNAGVSLVGAGAKSPGVHQDQPLSTGKPGVWRGRTPPPSHPLSLQALWPLDTFDFENGPTFVLPRTHARAERLDVWMDNGTALLGPRGLFPARFVTAEPGDVVFLLGSTWHGAAAHARAGATTAGRPRVALLYEYAPRFVAPRDRYHPQLLARAVPAEFRALFPALDVEGAAVAAAGARGAGEGEPECADGSLDVVSVWEWPRLMRERPHCARPSTRVLLRAGRAAMPVFGLGTGSPDDQPDVIGAAIRAGYRLVDTGELYGNEALVAEGVRLSGVHREGVFLSSKTGSWCPGWYATPRGTMARAVCIGGFEETTAAVRGSLERLGQAYLDLYLLHWPMSAAAGLEPEPLPDGSRALRLDDPAHAAAREGAWRALLALRAQGVLRAVGVSNFSVRQLEQLRVATGELPDVLQLELHPLLQRPSLRAYCEANGILIQVRLRAPLPRARLAARPH